MRLRLFFLSSAALESWGCFFCSSIVSFFNSFIFSSFNFLPSRFFCSRSKRSFLRCALDFLGGRVRSFIVLRSIDPLTTIFDSSLFLLSLNTFSDLEPSGFDVVSSVFASSDTASCVLSSA